jgi:hypothetical protein
MAIQAITEPTQAGRLVGDVPVLSIVAAALAVLTPRKGISANTL